MQLISGEAFNAPAHPHMRLANDQSLIAHDVASYIAAASNPTAIILYTSRCDQTFL